MRADGIKLEKVSRHCWLVFGTANDHELAGVRPAVSDRVRLFVQRCDWGSVICNDTSLRSEWYVESH